MGIEGVRHLYPCKCPDIMINLYIIYKKYRIKQSEMAKFYNER